MKLSELTVEQNKALIEHFPYLQPRNLWTDKIPEDYSYEYVRGAHELPDGWHRLFLLYCMSIKPPLRKANFIDQFRFSQIKEKWGEMTIYDNGTPRDIHDELTDLNYIYARISKLICQYCGSRSQYETRGWVSYFCKDCGEKHFSEEGLIEIDEPDFIVRLESWEAIKDENNNIIDYNKIVRTLDVFPYLEEYLNCLKLSDEEFLNYIFTYVGARYENI